MSNTKESQSQIEFCTGRFDKIDNKLDKLDMAIRGNGKPGINERLSRTEERVKTLFNKDGDPIVTPKPLAQTSSKDEFSLSWDGLSAKGKGVAMADAIMTRLGRLVVVSGVVFYLLKHFNALPSFLQ